MPMTDIDDPRATIDALMSRIRKFRDERDWLQFHTPNRVYA